MTPWDPQSLTGPALYAATFVVGIVAGLIPFVINVELYLVAVAALTNASPVAMVGLMTLGQMIAKFLLYLAGKGALNLRFIRRERMERAAAAFDKYRGHTLGVVAFSAVTGFPPFYAVSLLAGAARLPAASFLVVGTVGRIIRFGAVYAAPWYFQHPQ